MPVIVCSFAGVFGFMVRKITYIVFAMLLLTATTGFPASKHFCSMQIAEAGLNTDAETCCEDMAANDCCYDKTVSYQFRADFLSPLIYQRLQVVKRNIFHPGTDENISTYIKTKGKNYILLQSLPPPALSTRLSLLMSFLT